MNAYTESREKILEAAHASETLEKKPKSKKPKVRFRTTILERPSHCLPLNLLFSTPCPQYLTSSICACNSTIFVCVCLPSVLPHNPSSYPLPSLIYLRASHPSALFAFSIPAVPPLRPYASHSQKPSPIALPHSVMRQFPFLPSLLITTHSILALFAMKRIFLALTHLPSVVATATAVDAGVTT